MSSSARVIEANATAPVMVRVTAPSTLEEGYTFDAVFNGEVFPVTVPPGGVKAGQTFTVPFLPAAEAVVIGVVQDPESSGGHAESTPMLPQPNPPASRSFPPGYSGSSSNSSSSQPQPLGTWKTHWFDCLSEGCCHPSLCKAIWVPQILMGQVLTRMKLNYCGNPSGTAYQHTTCIWVLLTLGYFYFRLRLSGCAVEYPSNTVWGSVLLDDDDIKHSKHSKPDSCTEDDSDLLWVINWVWFWITVPILASLRGRVRRAHGIATSLPCEDFCCAAVLGCCTVTQLARQTQTDDDRESCCTDTGLAEGYFARREAVERRHHHGHHLVHAHLCDEGRPHHHGPHVV